MKYYEWTYNCLFYICTLGKDYQKPIVDHDVAMKANLERMKQAYKTKDEGKQKHGLRLLCGS